MNLTELTAPPPAAIPVRDFADHLRLGSGFADEGAEDALLEAYLRAAIAAIEARTGKVLLEREFNWDLTRWFAPDRQGLPVGPVNEVTALALFARDGTEVAVDPASFTLRRDLFRPELVAAALPAIPYGGLVRIQFRAGFGPGWSDVPADLAQAVMMLAAENYEARSDRHGAGASMPFGVLALIERYKTVRLLGDVL